jgi:two-component system, cell cycle response regulator
MTLAPKILVADDDQALSRTLSWILKENGYEVLTVPGGEHLFDHLNAEQFDLLLLDIMMPKVDGLQLLQRVKSDPRFKDLPVLMISSMPRRRRSDPSASGPRTSSPSRSGCGSCWRG